MPAAASGLNTEIRQFDWFTSGWIFPVLPAWGGGEGGILKKRCLCLIKINNLDEI